MSSKPPHPDSVPPLEECEDAVWALLEQAPPPEADPMFSRKVMRAIRVETSAPSRGWRWRSPLVFSAATAACGIFAGFFVARQAEPPAAAAEMVSADGAVASPTFVSRDEGADFAFDLLPFQETEEDEWVLAISEHFEDYNDLEVRILLGL